VNLVGGGLILGQLIRKDRTSGADSGGSRLESAGRALVEYERAVDLW